MENHHPLDYKPTGHPMALIYLEYADVYKDAIEILLNEFSKHDPVHDYSLIPVLALLRQYIELQLKGIIMYCENREFGKDLIRHNILELYEKAHGVIRSRYSVPEPNLDVSEFIKRLGDFDKTGQVFRYPETIEGKDFFESIGPELRHQISAVPKLKEIAEKVFGDLEGLEGYLDYQKKNEEEKKIIEESSR